MSKAKKLLCIIFAVFIVLIFGGYHEFDEIGLYFITEKSEAGGVNLFLTSIFNPTNAIILCAMVSLILIAMKKNKSAIFLDLSMILTTLINETIKRIIARPRPEYSLFLEKGYSFASGHSAASACFFACVFLILKPHLKEEKHLRIAAALCTFFTGYIGYTRLFFGVHYFSDVIAGFFLGITIAILVHNFLIKRDSLKKEYKNERL